MISYNIYFGTIGKTLGVRYRFSKDCRTEAEANKIAKDSAVTFYYKNEGTHGIPTFEKVNKESNITGVSIERLYEEHINDMMRYYAIPTELDTVSTKQLKYNYRY